MKYEELLEYCEVSRETFDKLTVYVDDLLQWNQKINLVGSTTTGDVWIRHIVDALQLIPYTEKVKRLVDLGSGAGLPGMILGIAGECDVSLVESDQKKMAFLRHIKGKLGVNVTLIEKRIEKVEGQFDIVTARALAALDKLISYAVPLLSVGGICLFLKGESYKNEVEEASKNWHFNIDVYSSVTHANAKIVKLSEVKQHGQDESHSSIQPKGRRR